MDAAFIRGLSMNAYTTRTQSRIRQSDLTNLLGAGSITAAASLRALEWTRGCQAEAELDWLLKQHGVRPQASAAPVSMLRQAIGGALVRAGERLAGASRGVKAPEAVPAADSLGTAG
jgi:hypothetical protein